MSYVHRISETSRASNASTTIRSASAKPGFTIVETSLAMSFVAVLLITVSMIIIQMTSIYQKTLTVKAVNAAGRELVDDFSHYISASTLINTNMLCGGLDEGYRDACRSDGAYKFIYQQYESANFQIAGKNAEKTVPTSGVFCTGRYTYLWNSGYVLNASNRGAETYRASVSYTLPNVDETITKNDFRLLRVKTSGNDICAANVNGKTYSTDTVDPANISYNLGDLAEEPEELLSTSEADLAVYDLRVFRPGRHNLTGHAFYSGTFILATLQGDVDITASGDFCTAPLDTNISEFTYCAINKFNFASQATGESDV